MNISIPGNRFESRLTVTMLSSVLLLNSAVAGDLAAVIDAVEDVELTLRGSPQVREDEDWCETTIGDIKEHRYQAVQPSAVFDTVESANRYLNSGMRTTLDLATETVSGRLILEPIGPFTIFASLGGFFVVEITEFRVADSEEPDYFLPGPLNRIYSSEACEYAGGFLGIGLGSPTPSNYGVATNGVSYMMWNFYATSGSLGLDLYQLDRQGNLDNATCRFQGVERVIR